MKAFALLLLTATIAGAIETCPDGEFVPFGSTGFTRSGNTCLEQFTGEGVSNGYLPQNYQSSVAPDHGFITILPANTPYCIQIDSMGFQGVVEVRDVQNNSCNSPVYGFVQRFKPQSPSGCYPSGFDSNRALGIFVDGQRDRGANCGPYTITLYSTAAN